MSLAADLVAQCDAKIQASTSQPTCWPAASVTEACVEGELWVSRDLRAFAHPQDEWVRGRPLYATDTTTHDADRSRVFRRLDKDWYAWLYLALSAARPRLEAEAPAQWQELAARFRALWAVACRWWGQAAVGWLQRCPELDARYAAPLALPRPGTVVERLVAEPALPIPSPEDVSGPIESWALSWRMQHAQRCADLLLSRHRVRTGFDGRYVGPEGLTRADLLALASQVCAEVRLDLRSLAAEHAETAHVA